MIREVLESYHVNPKAWTPLILSKTSKTYGISPIIDKILGKLPIDRDDLVALYRDSDHKCLIFRQFDGEFWPLPALFTLELSVSILEHIRENSIIFELMHLVNSSHKLVGNFWSLK